MGTTKTDNVVFEEGVTPRDGVTEDRSVTIGDNITGFLLLESGDFLLQEDNTGKFLLNINID